MHVLNSGQKSDIDDEIHSYKNNGIVDRLNKIEKVYKGVNDIYSKINIGGLHKFRLREIYSSLMEKKKDIKTVTHLNLDVIMNELDSDVEDAIKSMMKKRLRKKATKRYKTILDRWNPGFSVSIDEELEDFGTNSYGKGMSSDES